MIYTADEIHVAVQDDHTNLTNQLINLIPPSWTSTDAKKRGGSFWTLMSAIGYMLAYVKGLIDQLKRQFRLSSATNDTLDLMARDYFSDDRTLALPRLRDEDDDQYRHRIRSQILMLRTTRRGIRRVVRRITGHSPVILENLNVNTFSAWTGPTVDGKTALPLQGGGFPSGSTFKSYYGAYASNSADFLHDLSLNLPTVPTNNLAVSLTVTTGLKVWLKAQTLGDLGYVAAQKVMSWPNVSPNGGGYDGVPASDAARPTFRQATNGVMDSVRFDAVDDQLSIGVDSGTDRFYTMFIVYQPLSNLVTNVTRDVVVADGGFSLGYTTTGGYQLNNNGGVSNIESKLKITRRWTVMQTIKCTGGPASLILPNQTRMRVNGREYGANAFYPRISGLKLGGGAANPSDCEVFEFLYYNRVLTTTEVADVETYLSARYLLDPIWAVSPQPGIGALGGSQFGAPYNFFVFVLENRRQASKAAILNVIKRSKPIGTVENLFLSKPS